jgi:L-fuconolactonase
MLIADAQVHIWGPNTPERPWRDGPVKPHREPPLTAEELIREMDVAGVNRAILVPPSWDNDRNDLCLAAAQRWPDRFAVMGRMALEAPDARTKIAAWCQQKGMLGLRASFNRPKWTPVLTEGRVDWLFEEAEKAGMPLMLMITHALVPLIDRYAEKHPKLRLTICHLALNSSKKDDEAFRDLDLLLAIAKRPNVAVKVSALPTYTSDVYPYRALHPHLKRVHAAFGAQRMFWGTDMARLPCTYRQSVTMFTEEMPFFPKTDLEWIMGRGLCEWLGWKVP